MIRFVRTSGVCALVGILLLAGRVVADEAAAKEQPGPPKTDGAAADTAPKAEEVSQQIEAGQPAQGEKKAEAGKKPETEKVQPKESKAEAEEKPQQQKPGTVKVTKEPFKIELELKGVFEASNVAEIALRLKQWKELTVVEAVEHGREVRQGDVLVRFDLEKIDEQIDDTRKSLELSDLSIRQSEANLQILEKSTPLDLELAARSKKNVDEDLDRFLKVDKALLRKSADFMLKVSQDNLEYEQEELRQLEKMYKADDLTEETEEIILKRQRNSVERAKYYLETAKANHEETLQVELPRQEEARRYLAKQQDLVNQRIQATLPVSVDQQRIQLEKTKVERERSQDRLKELLADREAMTVKAPTDGIVYYGQYGRGQWTGATSTADDLRPGGSVGRDKVFMTIVKPRPMTIRAEVPESSLHYVRPGLKGTATPTGYPDLKLPAMVDAVDTVPMGGQFAATVKVALPHEADSLMPGMNCTVKVTPYLKKSALVAPASAVFSEKLDPDSKYVYLCREGKKPQKQPVTVGKKSDDRIEILEGLDNGDEILSEEPKQ